MTGASRVGNDSQLDLLDAANPARLLTFHQQVDASVVRDSQRSVMLSWYSPSAVVQPLL